MVPNLTRKYSQSVEQIVIQYEYGFYNQYIIFRTNLKCDIWNRLMSNLSRNFDWLSDVVSHTVLTRELNSAHVNWAINDSSAQY